MDLRSKTSRDETDVLLIEAVMQGNIDLKHIADQTREMMQRKEILKDVHIWHDDARGCYFAHMYDEDKKRILIRRKNKKDLEDEIVSRVSEKQKAPLFVDLFKEWNDTRTAHGFIEESTRCINEDLFKRFLSGIAKKRINELTPENIASYLERIISTEEMTAKAFSNVKGLVKGTVRFAKREGYVAFNGDDIEHELDVPERAFRVIRRKDEDEIFTNDEMAVIMGYLTEHADNIRNIAVLILFITGLRVGELVALKWKDVHEDRITVCATETRKKDMDGNWVFFVRPSAKTAAGEREVPIPDAYRWIWHAIRKATENSSGYVVVNENKERMNAQSIRKHFTRLLIKLGLPHRSPHKIRKTYCTILYEQGVDPTVIAAMLGHVDESISRKFYLRDRYTIDDKNKIVSSVFDQYTQDKSREY